MCERTIALVEIAVTSAIDYGVIHTYFSPFFQWPYLFGLDVKFNLFPFLSYPLGKLTHCVNRKIPEVRRENGDAVVLLLQPGHIVDRPYFAT